MLTLVLGTGLCGSSSVAHHVPQGPKQQIAERALNTFTARVQVPLLHIGTCTSSNRQTRALQLELQDSAFERDLQDSQEGKDIEKQRQKQRLQRGE